VHSEVLNPRRAPRVAHRCSVAIRDRFASWTAETEDLGPRGCQLVTPRLAARGRELVLQIRCEAIRRTIRAIGTVIWSRAVEPSRLGVAFRPDRTDPGWFEVLLQADPSAARSIHRSPDRLSRSATLYLGEPPRYLSDFSAEEVAVLQRIQHGATVDEVAQALGSAFDRVCGAMFSLVARRFLVLSPGEAVSPERWQGVLDSAEQALEADRIALIAPGPPARPGAAGRSAAAQALLEAGMDHLRAGRIEVAVARLREARALAPTDATIAGALERLTPWSS
jgi:PilZ domain